MALSIIVTGAAGFIGYHMADFLCQQGHRVFGIDNLNDYYDVELKKSRLARLNQYGNFSFHKADIGKMDEMERIFALAKPSHVIHLAAQAGIRYSMEHPESYIESNMLGFFNVIETSRKNGVEHFLYASSSSVYGKSQNVPYLEDDRTDEPISLYAATKKSNELMAHVYSHLYKLPTTGMRFFTVYGPWGRPDMAYFKFTQSLYANQTIDLYNSGHMQRDFTYIDDVKEAIGELLHVKPQGEPPFAIYNIGRTQPEELLGLVEMLEAKTGLEAKLRMLPIQAGEVLVTMADTTKLESTIGFSPSTSLSDGLDHFLEWFRNYHQIV